MVRQDKRNNKEGIHNNKGERQTHERELERVLLNGDVLPLFCIQHFPLTTLPKFQVVDVTAHLLAVCGRCGLIYRTEIIQILPYTPEFQLGRNRREMKSAQLTIA